MASVWAFVWGSVVGQHWVCGDVFDVKSECDLVGVRSGVERENVADGVTARVVDELKIVDVLNDVVNVVKNENGIGVHVDDVEEEWRSGKLISRWYVISMELLRWWMPLRYSRKK